MTNQNFHIIVYKVLFVEQIYRLFFFKSYIYIFYLKKKTIIKKNLAILMDSHGYTGKCVSIYYGNQIIYFHTRAVPWTFQLIYAKYFVNETSESGPKKAGICLLYTGKCFPPFYFRPIYPRYQWANLRLGKF